MLLNLLSVYHYLIDFASVIFDCMLTAEVKLSRFCESDAVVDVSCY